MGTGRFGLSDDVDAFDALCNGLGRFHPNCIIDDEHGSSVELSRNLLCALVVHQRFIRESIAFEIHKNAAVAVLQGKSEKVSRNKPGQWPSDEVAIEGPHIPGGSCTHLGAEAQCISVAREVGPEQELPCVLSIVL